MKLPFLKTALCILLLSMSPYNFAKTTIDTSTSEATAIKPDVSNVQLSAKDDAMITQSVQSQIKNSPTLNTQSITVQSNNGVVKISGNVDSDSNASSLVQIAESVVGVKDVDTADLKVAASKQPLEDTFITAKIKGMLIREEVFGTKDIASINMSVETKNGIVYLTGVIDNKDQLKNAIKLIKEISGVKKVEFSVKHVKPTAAEQHSTHSYQ